MTEGGEEDVAPRGMKAKENFVFLMRDGQCVDPGGGGRGAWLP